MDKAKDGLLRLEILDLNNDPLPYLREEIEEIIKVCLAGGRINDSFKRDAKEGEAEYENKEPEDEIKHIPYIIPRIVVGAKISA